MSSIKQRGEKIMVFGTNLFVEQQNMELLNQAIRVIEDGQGTLLTEMVHADWLTWEEFKELMAPGKTPSNEYFPLKFMLACFMLLEFGEEF